MSDMHDDHKHDSNPGRALRTELWRRRVPHIAGAYFAGGWILLEFTDWAVGRWVLSEHITDVVVTVWLLMIPAVVLLAWTHGAPGRDRWSRTEVFGVLLNAVLVAGLLFVLFRGRDLGAATSTVLVEDEEGNTVERVVPKHEYTRRLAVFAFRNESDDPDLDWLQLGIPWSLDVDLSQDNWVYSVTGFGDEAGEGFASPSHLPLARQREIARERLFDHLLVGTVERRDGELAITTTLYEAATASPVAERTFAGADALSLVDRASLAVRQDLGVPSGHIARTADLPVSELLSSAPIAVRAFFQAEYARNRDAAERQRLLAAAVGTDSTFALAQAMLGEGYIAFNQPTEAYAAYEAALRHEYRLSESFRYRVKARYYQINREPDRALRVARLATELYPEDVASWDLLASLLANRGDTEGAIDAVRRVLELDPSSFARVEDLGALYMSAGRFEDARRTFQRYADRHPDNVRPIRALGHLYLQLGEFETAAAYFERALLVAPSDYASLVALGDIARRTAEFDAARTYYDRAIGATGDPSRIWDVGSRLIGFFDLQGRTDSAIARAEAYAGYLGGSQGRLIQIRERVNSIALYPRAGRPDRARSLLDSLRAELEPPLSLFVPIGEALLYRELGDGEALEAKVPEARRLYDEFGLTALDWVMFYLAGEALRLQGDCEAALPLYEQALRGMPTGMQGAMDTSLGGNPRLGLGMCYGELGRPADAVTALQQGLQRVPADARTRYQLALLLHAQGRREEALSQLRGAVHVWRNADPSHRLAAEARARLTAWEGRS